MLTYSYIRPGNGCQRLCTRISKFLAFERGVGHSRLTWDFAHLALAATVAFGNPRGLHDAVGITCYALTFEGSIEHFHVGPAEHISISI